MRRRDRLEDTETLIRRLDVLERLCRSPSYVRDLVDETDHSRSTINRAIADLEELNLLERGENGIEATMAGRLAHDRLESFLSDLDDVFTAEAVLEPISADAEIDLAAVAGGEAILAAEPAPYRPLVRLHDDLADARRYRALVPTLEDPRLIRLLYEHVITDGNPAEIVVTPEVFQTLRREFPRRTAAMAESDGFSVFVGQPPPVGLGLLEGDFGPASTTGTVAHVVVLNESGGVHGVLRNATEGALRWAEQTYAEYRDEATDRTDALIPDPDGGVRSLDGGYVTTGQSLPMSLEREGFVRVDRSYFLEEPVADPPTAWRAGLSLTEVHTGYAVRRPHRTVREDAPTTDESAATADESGLASALAETLAAGADCLVLGPPGSGKSTICKQVACDWYDAGRGPVLYREAGRGNTHEATDALVAAATAADGHALVVVEDAVRPDADAAFGAIERLADRDDVSFLLDAREHEWGDRADSSAVGSELEVVHVPPMTGADCERLVDHFARTSGRPLDVSAEGLWAAIREETAAGDDAHHELLRLIHRLATYADPLATEPTALEEAVASIYEDLADDEVALSVCILANALNAAGIGVDRGLLYAVADPDEYDAVDDALERIEGRVLFARDSGRYRTVHEEWSTAFLAHLVDTDGEVGAERFGGAVSAVLELADEPDRCELIETHLGNRTASAAITEADGHWADETVESIYTAVRERAQLAPLLGDGDSDTVDLPEAVSVAVRVERPRWLGRAFLRGGDYDRAEAAFERLPLEPAEIGGDRLLGLADVAFERGEYRDAVDHSRECLSLVDGDTVLEARARIRLGRGLVELGEYDDATEHYRAALEAFRAVSNVRGEATTMLRLGELAHTQDEYDEADEWYYPGLELMRDLGDRQGEAEALNDLGGVAWRRGELDRARRRYEQSLELRSNLGDRHGEAKILYNLGLIETTEGAYERARELLEEGVSILQEVGDRHLEARVTQLLGTIARRRGADGARRSYERSLAIYRELGTVREEVLVLYNLGTLHRERGEYDRSRRVLVRSLELVDELEDRRRESATLAHLGHVQCDRGEYERARRSAERSYELAEELEKPSTLGESTYALGRIALRRGRYDRAERLLERSIDYFSTSGDTSDEGRTLIDLGIAARRRGDDERAEACFHGALESATEIGEPLPIARSRCELADVAIRDGALEEASEHLDSAHEAVEGRRFAIEPRIHLSRGRLALARDDVDSSRSHAQSAFEDYEEMGLARWAAKSTLLLGRIAATAEDREAAREHLVDALETFEELEARFWVARSRELLGRIALNADEPEVAREHLRDAVDEFEAIGANRDARRTAETLLDAFAGDEAAAERFRERAEELSAPDPETFGPDSSE